VLEAEGTEDVCEIPAADLEVDCVVVAAVSELPMEKVSVESSDEVVMLSSSSLAIVKQN
jgi:hypothetical protein